MNGLVLLTCVLLGAEPTAEQRELLKVFRDEFVEITPGEGKFPKSFQMGRAEGGSPAEAPATKITFGHKFSIAKYEVPQNLWQAVMGANPSRWKGKRNSVEMLTHAEAAQFCAKATELMRSAKMIDANHVVRLPTEAEWEYCARAGTTTVYSFGDSVDDLGKFAWFTGNAAGNDPPVGAKQPNAWGLYDMHGYLWEWCADAWQPTLEGTPTDGTARKVADAKKHVVRSGSWKDKADRLTSSFRLGIDSVTLDDAVGLRCVLATEATK